MFSVNMPVTSRKLIAASLIDTWNDSRLSTPVVSLVRGSSRHIRRAFLSSLRHYSDTWSFSPSYHSPLFPGRNSRPFRLAVLFVSLHAARGNSRTRRGGDGLNVVLITDVATFPQTRRTQSWLLPLLLFASLASTVGG